MNRFLSALTLVGILLGFTACPPDAEVAPAFVEIDGFTLNTSAGQGANTTAIREVWAFANNSFIGAFPLPARIPVARVGNTELRFEAGIRQNGISRTPDIYEFYAPVNRNLDLVSGSTVNLGTLTTTYREDTKFAFLEGFETNSSRVFTDRIAGEATLIPVEDIVRSGSFSGKLELSTDDPLVELGTADPLRGLTDQRPYVWLEVDFRSTASVVWGVQGNIGIEPVRVFDPGFQPRNEWTKIYFNLSEIIVRSTLDEYRIVLSALLPAGSENAEVYLDNVKLLHF
jgi:hypothetical protein